MGYTLALAPILKVTPEDSFVSFLTTYMTPPTVYHFYMTFSETTVMGFHRIEYFDSENIQTMLNVKTDALVYRTKN